MRKMTSVGLYVLIARCGMVGCGGTGATTPLYVITSPANGADDVADPVGFTGTDPTTHVATTGPELWVGEYDEAGNTRPWGQRRYRGVERRDKQKVKLLMRNVVVSS